MNESVREFLHILFKRKRFVGIAFLAISIPIIVFTLVRAPKYLARAKLLVIGSRSYLHLSPQETRKTTQIPEAQVIFAEIENLQNRSFLLAAARRLQVDIVEDAPTDPEDRARVTAAAIRLGLQVNAFPKSPMIEVAFLHSDKNLAAAVVNTLVDTYLEYHPSLYESPEVATFFDKRKSELESQLGAAESELDDYQSRTGIVDLDQQLDETVRQMMASELAMKETVALIAQTDELIGELERTLANEPERVASDVNMVNNPVARALEERIGILTVELSDLRQKYTEEDRRVRDKMRQIAELRSQVAEQPQRIIGTERFERNPVRQNLEEELHRARANREALLAKKASLEATVTTYRERIQEIDKHGSPLRSLETNVTQLQAALNAAIEDAHEASLSMEMSANKLDTVRVVDRAYPPPTPSGENTLLTILVALIAGAALGIAGAFGLEYLYQTYHFGSDIERELELPVLGLISDIRTS
ncbi:MAG: hypothetical protein FJ144_11860 [Deltaproteobacteria bacterium]|nr:hypothetical protein [Deltaproteobacteria bacterium]